MKKKKAPMKTKNFISSLFLKSKTNKKKWSTILVVVILAGVLYYFKGQFIVAVVNGKPILRSTIIREIEKQAGGGVLDSLINKALILQEAKKQNINVSDDEINQEIIKIEEDFAKQNQDLDQLLVSRGMTRNELKEQIKMQKIIEKFTKKDIEVSDEEIDDYLEENKDLLPQDLEIEEIKEGIRQQLEQQKMNVKIQSWIESLHDKAKIHYFRSYP